jgi:hypothetical protein
MAQSSETVIIARYHSETIRMGGLKRRDVLASLGAVGAGAIAGCTAFRSENGDDATTSTGRDGTVGRDSGGTVGEDSNGTTQRPTGSAARDSSGATTGGSTDSAVEPWARAWAPAPETLGTDRGYTARTNNYAAIREHGPTEYLTGVERSVEQAVEPLGLAFDDVDWVTDLLGGSAAVVGTDRPASALGTALADEGYARSETDGSFALYRRDDDATFAVGDVVVRVGWELDGRRYAEPILGAKSGAVTRYAEASDWLGQVLDRLDGNAYRTWYPGEQYVPAVAGWGADWDLSADGSRERRVYVFESESAAADADLRGRFEDRAEYRDFPVSSVAIDGRVGTIIHDVPGDREPPAVGP